MPWAPGPKYKFFLHLGPVANWMGDRHPVAQQAPIFQKFPIRHIFLKFYFFLNIKMKKIAVASQPGLQQAAQAGAHRPSQLGKCPVAGRRDTAAQ